jgi:ATP-dependent Lon protease
LASAFTGRAVYKNVAMTGEVTLRGRVLPIGGLKEKSLAAKRMGIQKVIIPKRNEKDLDEIPKYIKKDMKFIPVETVDEVLKNALSKTTKKTRR